MATHLSQGDELLFAQKYARAEAAYRKALKRLDDESSGRSKSADARRALERLGRINTLYLHNYPQALEDLTRLVGDFGSSDEAYQAQQLVADIHYHRVQDLEAAVADYAKLVTDWPEQPGAARAQLTLSDLYFKLKNYEQAAHEAHVVVEKWPQSPEVPKARFAIANIEFTLGKFSEALADYGQLVKDFPDDEIVPLAKFEMANCQQELGQSGEAMTLLKDTLRDHPHPHLVQRKMVRIQRRIDKTAPAKIITDTKGTPYIKRPAPQKKKATAATEEAAPAPAAEPEAAAGED